MTDLRREPTTPTTDGHRVEHVDVLIVGAGISGVAAAYHLGEQSPDQSFVVLESKDTFGGTWQTHTYPGIRSDSDLYTFGYRFKPWTSAPIATAEEILSYMGEVIEENDLDRHIRYRHAISTASWSSDERLWTIEATNTATEKPVAFTASFLWMCQGYYRHSEGYTPEWDGFDRFQGTVVHPQTWPDDLDYAGKKVVVIGSGATAATLIPAMAPDVEHITMLQRSPTYFATGRNAQELADTLRELEIDESWIHEITRRKIIFDGDARTRASAEYPDLVKAELFKGIREILGEDYDVSEHFEPRYRPWRQRIAFVPDGDLFHGIKSGKASVVTGEIDSFTETGIALTSGESLDADIIVTATGFNLNVLGDIAFTIDDEPLEFHDTVTYRGMMFTGIPNMVWVFGYFRASWTLRAELIADFVCRLLNHMQANDQSVVVPVVGGGDTDMELRPWVDPEDFNPGYLTRSLHLMPKQGDRHPWMMTQDFLFDEKDLPAIDLGNDSLVFE